MHVIRKIVILSRCCVEVLCVCVCEREREREREREKEREIHVLLDVSRFYEMKQEEDMKN